MRRTYRCIYHIAAISSVEFCLGEVHLWVSVHELLQCLLLCHFVRSRETHLFLSLIEHHFLNNASSVAIQVRKLRVLRLNLASVDISIALNDSVPPCLLILLGEGELEEALARVVRLNAPKRVTLLHRLVEGAVNHQGLPLDANLKVSLGDVDGELLGRDTLGDLNVYGDLGQGLLPVVLFGGESIAGVRHLSLVLLFLFFFTILAFLSVSNTSNFSSVRVGRTSLLLSLNQGSFLLSDLNDSRLISFILLILSSGAFSCRLFCGRLTLPLDLLLILDVLLEFPDVLGQVLVDHGHGAVLLRVKVSLTAEEAEKIVKESLDSLSLLHCSHEKPVEAFLLSTHYFFLFLDFNCNLEDSRRIWPHGVLGFWGFGVLE